MHKEGTLLSIAFFYSSSTQGSSSIASKYISFKLHSTCMYIIVGAQRYYTDVPADLRSPPIRRWFVLIMTPKMHKTIVSDTLLFLFASSRYSSRIPHPSDGGHGRWIHTGLVRVVVHIFLLSKTSGTRWPLEWYFPPSQSPLRCSFRIFVWMQCNA